MGMEIYPDEFTDAKEFHGIRQNFTGYVGDKKFIQMKRHSIELAEYRGGKGVSFSATYLIAIEREPGYFSMHDTTEMSNCIAIDDQWTGQQGNSEGDANNNLIVTQKYNGSSSQLWRWIRVSKTRTDFHIISKSRNDFGQEMAITYQDNQLKICPHNLKNDKHDVSLQLRPDMSTVRLAMCSFVFFMLMYMGLMITRVSFYYGVYGIILTVVCISCMFAVPAKIGTGSMRKVLDQFPFEGEDMV